MFHYGIIYQDFHSLFVATRGQTSLHPVCRFVYLQSVYSHTHS